MRYFCTHPPLPLLILFFSLSFLTLSLSLKTEQAEIMKNISTLIHKWEHHQADPCGWHGVSCSESGNDVVGLELSDYYSNKISSIWKYVCQLPSLQLLDLSYNYIEGPIPHCLGSFPSLTILRLSYNGLSGSIPPQLASLSNLFILGTLVFCSMFVSCHPSLQLLDISNSLLQCPIPHCVGSFPNLTDLRLSSNLLSGFIPPQLLSLTTLEYLDLSFNHLSGEIPHFSSNLLWLSMENNNLKGTIPSTISNARNLTHLGMSYNLLNGPIPGQIGSCSRLNSLWLDNNKLQGPLNHVLPKLLHLTSLSLSNNMFEGSILHDLSNLSNLTLVDLSHNLLSGNIASKIFNLQQLTSLCLQRNYLTGIIPFNIKNVKLLKELRLDRNNLTGTIPVGIGNLPLLGVLNLSHNSLTGKIPITFSNLRFVSSLDCSNNMLTGEIPEALANMAQLDRLDISNNKLTGEIPEALGHISYLNWLDLSNNELTGEIPESVKGIGYLNLTNNKLVTSIPTRTGRSHFTLKIMGVVSVVALFIICCLVLGVMWKRNLQSIARFKQTIREMLEKVEHPRISHEELLAATNRFHNSNLIATNSFGSVYKGFLPDGTRVAVKVLNLMHEQSEKIFRAECRVLQKARHRNLGRIITTCSSPHFKALVFEYFTNGSLEKHLYLDRCRLGLRKLLNIATDVAHAVEYLHYDCFVQIVHCDIKPSNVLLDESMTAHLSDYGISRLIERITGNSVTSTMDLKGSVGYIAPEYGLNGMISPRGDVYSYGILLLEMLTRRRPTDNMFDGDLNLHNLVKRAFPDGAFEVIDENLLMERAGKETEECLISLKV